MSRRADREGVKRPHKIDTPHDPVATRAWVVQNSGDRGEALRQDGDILFGSVVYAHLREPVRLP